MMKGGCYGATVLAINKFQVQALECFVIFFIIVDSIPPISILKVTSDQELKILIRKWMPMMKGEGQHKS